MSHSQTDERVIYLGRRGEVAGPFPAAKLDELRLTGQIWNYTYIWDDSSRQWRNLDPLPPEPGAAVERKKEPSLDIVEAICHDHRSLVAGKIENVSDFGCELVSHDHSDAPRLALNSVLVLNVMNRKGEKAVNVRASAYEVSHQGGAWVYRIRWAHRPTF
jgi:hypothetical protein